MTKDNGYWQRYWRKRLSRRTLMRGTALGAGGLAAAAVVGCGDDDDVVGTPTAAPTATPAGTTPAATTPGAATPTPAGTPGPTPLTFPPPPAYSSISDRQALLRDFYWTQGAPDYQKYEEQPTNLGGIFVVPGGPQFSNHPGEVLLSVFGQWIWGFSHNGLVQVDFNHKSGNADLLPFTADLSVSESWETPDSQTFIFKLRTDDQGRLKPRFHARAPANGDRMTIDDIKTTYEFLATQQFPKLFFGVISSMEETSPGVLTIKTSEPAVQMLAGLAYCGYYIMHRKHIEEGKDSLTTQYIGTGPFQMDDETPNVVRKMSKVQDWWWGKDQWGNQMPYLDGIVHKQFGDREAIKAAFRTGSLDYIRNASDLDFETILDDVDAWGSVIVGNCHSCANFIALSQETLVNGEPFFADVDARRAVSMAIDRQGIIDSIYGGAANLKTWIGSGLLG